MGIHGSLLRWVESYLQKRSQLVNICGFKSAEIEVASGVPQGSHLGPLLFLIFVNDLCVNIKSNFKFYADDLKIYRVINNDLDKLILQTDINYICDWCHLNQMYLNPTKCFYIKFSRKIISDTVTYYINNNSTIQEVTSIRDLGVILDSSLSFRLHLDNIIKKASKLSGFINRQLKIFKQPSVSILLFNTFVRSILEYCSVVWSPCYQVHINRLECVQKRFLYHVSYTDNKCLELKSYAQRLNFYRASSLYTRRKINDIIFLYKIIHGLIDSSDVLQCIQFSIPRPNCRMRYCTTFCLPTSRTNVLSHSPLYRMCSSYNSIRFNYDIFTDSSIASLKKSLKKCFDSLNCN